MNAPRRFGVSGRFGLAVLVAWPSLVIGLALAKESPIGIALIAVLGMPLALLGAIAWLKVGQNHPKVFFQKRLVAGICAVATTVGLVSAALHQHRLESAQREAFICGNEP